MRNSEVHGELDGEVGGPGGPEVQPVGLLGRPLGARSVMASLLLGMDPPRIRGGLLVRWCGLFGIAEGTARVALSRMVGNGELSSVDGVYALAGALTSRRREQVWALAPRLRSWRGGWRMATVDPVARPASGRQALRDAMRHLRMAEVREGVWTRPDNLPDEASPDTARSIVGAQCSGWSTRPDDDPAELAGRLFAPAAWSARSDQLVSELAEVTARLREGGGGLEADAFLAGASALVHVRADPLLPRALLPPAWSGAELRAAYREYRLAFATATAAWFRRNRG